MPGFAPNFGMLQRGGQVVIQMLANVQQATIKPLIEQIIRAETLIYTDEYHIYSRLVEWAMLTKQSTMPKESMPAMKMAMAFTKFTSTLWKASGPYCAVGCDRIEVSRKKSYRSI
jgi:hypothetical protein